MHKEYCYRCKGEIYERGYGHYPDHKIEDCLESIGERLKEIEARLPKPAEDTDDANR